MTTGYAKELEQAKQFAREAGNILLEVYGTDFTVDLKGAVDPVTDADRRANAYLVQAIRDAFPEDGVVAEESEDNSDAVKRGRCWYVDPLDGTKEFVARNGEFSVMIGLAVSARSKLGVVYQPVTDKLYAGVVGEQAYIEQAGERRSVSVSDQAVCSELRIVVSRSHRSKATDRLTQRLGLSHEMQSGSVGLKIGLIVEQQADLYVHLSDRSCAWDACAPEAILRAAGGCFYDLAGGEFRYGGMEFRNLRGIVACNRAAYDKVKLVIAEVAEEEGLT